MQASKGLQPVRPTTERSSPWQSPQATERPRGRTGLARAGKVPERPAVPANTTRGRGTARRQHPSGSPAPRRQKAPIRSVSSAKQTARTHVIQPGDNFSLLAQRYYGSQKHTTFLFNANRNIDPRRMKVGSRLRIPPLSASVESEPARRTYNGLLVELPRSPFNEAHIRSCDSFLTAHR